MSQEGEGYTNDASRTENELGGNENGTANHQILLKYV